MDVGCPLTGVVFAIELTHDFNMLLPLLITCFVAYGTTVLTLKRSILTEKIARRGYHLTREYATDPLEIIFVREVMRTHVVGLQQAREMVRGGKRPHGQHVFPILDEGDTVVGVISRNRLRNAEHDDPRTLAELVVTPAVFAYTDEPLRAVVYRMAETGFTRMPVLDRDHSGQLAGMVALDDLLRARSRNLEEERERERVLRLRIPVLAARTVRE